MNERRDQTGGLHNDAQALIEASLANIREALAGIRFGNISLTIHEGRVVQIDVTEKRRFQAN